MRILFRRSSIFHIFFNVSIDFLIESEFYCITTYGFDCSYCTLRKTFVTRAELDEYKCSTLKEEEYTYKKLTRTYVKGGKTTEEYDKLVDVLNSQKYYLESLEKLSEERKRLEFPHKYKVNLSSDLRELKYSLINKISEELND